MSQPKPPPGRVSLLVLLTAVSTVNLLDRQVFAVLAEPIRRDLQLSDTQIGVLGGLAFAVLYSLISLPAGALADRIDRRRLLAAATGAWSLACGACGLAGGFVQLCLARMAVAVGEAGAAPASHAMLSDAFPPERRGLAIGIVQMGAPLGLLIAFAAGGPIAEAYGWRIAFMAAAVPGLIVSLLVLFLLRPEYGRPTGPAHARSGLISDFRLLVGVRDIRRAVIAGVFASLATYATLAWLPALMQREFGWSVGQAGAVLGPMIGVFGLVGTLMGGWLGDRLEISRPGRGRLALVRWAMLVAAAGAAAGLLAPAAGLVVAGFGVTCLTLAFFQAPLAATVQNAAPPERRASAAALYVFATNLVGIGLGPTAVGLLSDMLGQAGAESPLRWGLFVAPACALLCSLSLSGRSTKVAAA